MHLLWRAQTWSAVVHDAQVHDPDFQKGFSLIVFVVHDGTIKNVKHTKALEKEKYLSVLKTFVDRKPNTKYKITEKGRSSFKKHIDALEQVIKQQK